ncbi:hypothetical protein HMPREF9402_0026 [Turicibacter sp. HGF1]|uniref:hypothetical protein n=1 Tax=Turicibacter sp. HGF1 TaxID=910310 RepID=UPI0001FD9A0B|nr:hypothetical protein [Turicibacter sp. HGF1]EGC92627.1 hypothetical protein HMPREF9402_0026 [Turicibacter sp. HGF1]
METEFYSEDLAKNTGGTDVGEDSEVNKKTTLKLCNNLDEEKNSSDYVQKFEFQRHKSLGRMTMSTIYSTVEINNEKMKLSQEKILFYFYKKKFQWDINREDIKFINVKKTIDMSDLLFCVIFTLLGFKEIIFFIPALLLLWLGIGYKIEIWDIHENKLVIPDEIKQNCIEFKNIVEGIHEKHIS